eukprot:CAMPEP_0198149062 /NCGR_PEP_ID=MMETSP1443-20131203/44865_1 /TAXON_ID=186043 /ORGANISM="Entomoneis sp., Strain CCMP2396" /LENGTH=321 /DNA_ID=CAMNT_0043813977 /DNA_START=163 /DNA_END=1128 /DNA_ORIENTATION=+
MPGARAPSSVLWGLVEANPFAVIESDRHKFGGTPLHFCCGSLHREDPDTVRLFVETAVRVEKQLPGLLNETTRVNYHSPLYIAAKWGSPPRTIRALIEGGQQRTWIAPWTGAESCVTIPTDASYSPLESLFRLWQGHEEQSEPLDFEKMRELAERILNGTQAPDFSDELTFSEGNSYLKIWANIVVLMQPQFKASGTLLHAASKMYRPVRGLLRLMAAVYSESLLALDGNGEIPLHVAITNPIYPFMRIPDAEHPICVLLEACPESTVALPANDSKALFPAFLAASYDAPLQGIFELLQRAPDALEMQRQQFHAHGVGDSV